MNSLNTIIANAMEKYKLGEADFDEHDIEWFAQWNRCLAVTEVYAKVWLVD
jgi:hypothetical protein